jgi:transcriptional regulator with XRE-family HTH domain
MNDFGNALRRLRLEKGMSLAALAKLTNYSKGYLSKVESGVRPASDGIARVCDGALGTNGQLLAVLAHETRTAMANRLPILMPVGYTASSDQLEDGFRGDLDDYTAQFWSIFGTLRRMGHTMSPEIVLPMVLANIDTVSKVLQSAKAAPKHGLVLLAARFNEYAGWMAQEAGRDDLFQRLTAEAVRLAIEAGDHELPQFAVIRQADRALYNGDGRGIVDLTGRVLRCQNITPRTRSTAWLRQAQGYALLGDRSSCLRALDSARESDEADHAETGVRSLGTTSVGSQLEVTTGWSLVDLCRHDEAIPVLHKVVAGVSTDSMRSRVRFGVRLALAYASIGEREQASDLVRAVLPGLRQVDSDSIRVDLKALADMFRRRWARDVAVADLLAELRPQLGRSARRG